MHEKRLLERIRDFARDQDRRGEIDPSVPALVEGDLSGLEHMLEETIKKTAGAEGEKISLYAVARRNLPEGIEILFSAEAGKKASSFAMTFSDASPGEDSGKEEVPFTVLLAEDNPLSARIIESNLEALGFTVMKASDGRKVLALSEKHRFDLILMDIQMPVMDGLEATRALRRREKGTAGRIPVLAVSASREEEDRKRCIEAGMDGFLPKSSSPGEMAGILSPFLPHKEFNVPGDIAEENPLLAATGGNREAAAEAAGIFLQTAPPLMAEMKRAVAHGDRLLLASHAHRLKGNLVFFGAKKAAGLAQAMEEAAKGGSLEGLPSLLYALISEISLLMAELRKEWLPA
ncbi:MAG: response regulator [Synergistales bacterium]|nr:response regulator [Synergistales bacterium]